ncbi:hypothetical protein [Nocardia sp. AG03]|uniref:hypothetical protein n=1 Tax=Nocardia sp. AG03 TaxID=3025312 RepID=UPI002418B4EF|nr:hypothetical protein [Nocardia sp. AG03]
MIGKFETNKDLVQELTSSGARRVGNIAALITGTVAEVAREIGEFLTDAIEMNEAAAAARRDAAVERAEQRREAEDLDPTDETDDRATAWLTEPEPVVAEAEPAPGEPGKG